MATTSEARALPFFTDLLGQPLQAGSIYIGQAGLDPVAYPAVVTSDIAHTVVVAQPIRTTNGHAVAAGAQIHLFCAVPYSITVLDSAGRMVYASLNETDPVASAVSSSTVQSAASLADLRSRSGSSTNLIWVDGFGMYVYAPTDTTSPETVPSVIVGNDGSRYKLDAQYVNANWVHASGIGAPNSQGAWLSWNDFGNGATVLTNNLGAGASGFVLRTVNANNTVEMGRVTVGQDGSITSTGNITAVGTLVADGSIVALLGDLSRQLNFSGGTYNLPGAPLSVNGSTAVTQATLPASLPSPLASNQIAHGIGAVTLGTATMPSPGTWTLDSTIASVYLWVRTA